MTTSALCEKTYGLRPVGLRGLTSFPADVLGEFDREVIAEEGPESLDVSTEHFPRVSHSRGSKAKEGDHV